MSHTGNRGSGRNGANPHTIVVARMAASALVPGQLETHPTCFTGQVAEGPTNTGVFLRERRVMVGLGVGTVSNGTSGGDVKPADTGGPSDRRGPPDTAARVSALSIWRTPRSKRAARRLFPNCPSANPGGNAGGEDDDTDWSRVESFFVGTALPVWLGTTAREAPVALVVVAGTEISGTLVRFLFVRRPIDKTISSSPHIAPAAFACKCQLWPILQTAKPAPFSNKLAMQTCCAENCIIQCGGGINTWCKCSGRCDDGMVF